MAQASEQTLHSCLDQPGPSHLERMNSPWPRQEEEVGLHEGGPRVFLRRFQQACLDFDEAILKLPNLQTFSASFPPRFTWRGQHLACAYEFGPESPPVKEQTAPLAFMLRSLGRRSYSNTSLTSVRLDLRESGWGLHAIEQGLRFDGVVESESLARFRSRWLMAEAFTNLTDFDTTLKFNDNISGDFETLADLLSITANLVRLQITITDVGLDELYHHDMLSIINSRAQWPKKLEQLEMDNLSFKSDSLLRTLSHLAPTLQSLMVKNCELIEEESSWPDFYRRMRLISFRKLSHLSFKENGCEKDDTFPLCEPILDFSDNDIINNLLSIHRSSGCPSVGFTSEIYDFILKKTDIMPPLRTYALSSVEEKLRMREHARERDAERAAIAGGQQEMGNTLL